jgi:hypothetical protein
MAWFRIASELTDTVPAEILLGGVGSHTELDARLAKDDLDREVFRRTAIAIREECVSARDDSEEESLATSLERARVPEGFATRRQTAPSPQTPEPSSQDAHDLVLTLIGRVSTHDRCVHP